jgi:signal transduction histidine kinase/ActR/RegA family two-component response regulator
MATDISSRIDATSYRRLTLASRVFALIAALQGALALAGWITGIEALKGGYALGINIKANTAVVLLLLGLALLLLGPPRRRGWRTWIGRALAFLALAIGALTLFEHFTGRDLGIDQALFTEAPGLPATSSPNRMGPPASIIVPLIGLSLLISDSRPWKGVRLSQLAAALALLLAAVPLLGYVYGVRELFGLASFTGIALPTAICFVLLALGVLFARAHQGAMKLVIADNAGGMLFRRMFPAAIIIPVALGWASIAFQDMGLFDANFGRSLLTVSFMVVFSALIWWNAALIFRVAAGRDRAEDAERELSVRLRTALEGERAAREAAEHANRMKDEFLATLSHELRTPLNAILGWATLLAEEALSEEDMKRGLATIQRNARLQARLIEDLLDMSRIVSGQIRLEVRAVDLCHLVDMTVSAAVPSADAKGVALSRDLEQDACMVSGDPERVHQILWNLISNAVKFTPSGGQASVRLRRVGDVAEVTVTDNGIGISSGFLPHIFEQFHQEDASFTRRYGGLGLGLSIAQRLAHLHGGRIEAASPGEGKGATFTLFLPLMPARPDGDGPPADAAAGGAPDGRRSRLTGVRVLVVDDHADGREIAERVLKDAGADVASAMDAASAMTLVGARRFDVLVCDIALPDRDGYELLRDVRRGFPQVPAIALTAFAGDESEARARDGGYQVFLTRPVDPDRLVEAVRDAAGNRASIDAS